MSPQPTEKTIDRIYDKIDHLGDRITGMDRTMAGFIAKVDTRLTALEKTVDSMGAGEFKELCNKLMILHENNRKRKFSLAPNPVNQIDWLRIAKGVGYVVLTAAAAAGGYAAN